MKERTFTIIKPDAMAKKAEGKIIDRILKEGFEILALQMLNLTKTRAGEFYSIHKDKPFFGPLVSFMTSGSVIVMALGRNNAITHLRDIMGPTDSKKAPKNTIRGAFGTDIEKNAIHGSDSPKNAEREISFFFPDLE